MRIHFHIHRGTQIVIDHEGQAFRTLADARSEAVHSAREIMVGGLRGGYPTFHFAIRAVDEDGKLRFILPFEDAIPR